MATHGAMTSTMLLVLAACSPLPQPAEPPPTTTAPLHQSASELLAAPPHEWLARAEPLLRAGPPAGDALAAGLRATPGAPGAQAAVAVLGRIGGTTAVALLLELVTDRGPLAVEAALALGELQAGEAHSVLCACVDDRFADATLRTAAACALLRLGHRAAAASLLRGVLLAGTPAGQELQRELGLPEKPRWALERYFVQRALLHTAGTDFGLDTDASWPDLEQAAARISAWLDTPPTRKN